MEVQPQSKRVRRRPGMASVPRLSVARRNEQTGTTSCKQSRGLQPRRPNDFHPSSPNSSSLPSDSGTAAPDTSTPRVSAQSGVVGAQAAAPFTTSVAGQVVSAAALAASAAGTHRIAAADPAPATPAPSAPAPVTPLDVPAHDFFELEDLPPSRLGADDVDRRLSAAVQKAIQDANKIAYEKKVNDAFDEWARRIPLLVRPYLHGRSNHVLVPADVARDCTCCCPRSTRRSIRLVDLRALTHLHIQSCDDHFVARLVALGWFPANPSGAHTAFSFGLLELFQALQRHARLGSHGFASALFDFLHRDQGFALIDDTRKQLTRAVLWFDVLVQQVHHRVLRTSTSCLTPTSALPAPAHCPVSDSAQSSAVDNASARPTPASSPAPAAILLPVALTSNLASSRCATSSPAAAAVDIGAFDQEKLLPTASASSAFAPIFSSQSGPPPLESSQPYVLANRDPLPPHPCESQASASLPLHLNEPLPGTEQPHFPAPADDPDLQLTIQDLCDRCPACFAAITMKEKRALPPLTPQSAVPSSEFRQGTESTALPVPDLIVCLDGNFTHKRRKRRDAIDRVPSPPTFFLSQRQVIAAAAAFKLSAKSDGPRTGCSSEVKAAVVGAVKASKGGFDVVGLVGLTCRHGAPLLFCDVRDTGESHYYAFALLDFLLLICDGRLDTLGICYDIGCKLAVSPRIAASLCPRGVRLVFAVSLFHVFGHDVDCRLKYSPRRTTGFGLTDGEALERLWSSMSDLISTTRSMSAVGRHRALTALLRHIVTEHVGRISSTLKLRQARLEEVRRRAAAQVQAGTASVASWALSALPDAQQRSETDGPARKRTKRARRAVQLTPSTGSTPAYSPSLAVHKIPTSFPPSDTFFVTHFARLADLRRQKAFQRKGYRRPKNTSTQDLHLAAKSLWVVLSQWHALGAFIKRRHGIASQNTQNRLLSARTAAQGKAKRLRVQVNESITQSLSMEGILNVGPLYAVEDTHLWTPATLARVGRYAGSHVDADEPWFSDPVLEDGLDAFELLVRCDEEEARLDAELANLTKWLTSMRQTVQANRSALNTHGWADCLDHHFSRLKVLDTFWQRPAPRKRALASTFGRAPSPEPDGLSHLDDDAFQVADVEVHLADKGDSLEEEASESDGSEFSLGEDELLGDLPEDYDDDDDEDVEEGSDTFGDDATPGFK